MVLWFHKGIQSFAEHSGVIVAPHIRLLLRMHPKKNDQMKPENRVATMSLLLDNDVVWFHVYSRVPYFAKLVDS